jgi:hypothetical protein
MAEGCGAVEGNLIIVRAASTLLNLFSSITKILLYEFIEGYAKLRANGYQILFMLNTKPGMISLQSIEAGDSNTSGSCPGR